MVGGSGSGSCFQTASVSGEIRPRIHEGAYRSAMRVAFTEIDQGPSEREATRTSPGWKLFPMFPRLLLHKPPKGGLVPKKQLQHRFEVFTKGDWASLLIASMEHATRVAQASSRRSRRRNHDNLESKGARAEALIHIGEPSAACQALERIQTDVPQFSATPFRMTSFMLLQRNSSLWTSTCSP